MMDKKLTCFVCKGCGRAVKAERKPDYCYWDRLDHIENISDEDSIKMGLFQHPELSMEFQSYEPEMSFIAEFPGDVRYDVFTGEKMTPIISYYSLSDFHVEVLSRVFG